MAAFDTAKFGTVLQDVPYRKPGDAAQKLDLYFPDAGGPWPCVIFIHGGGWSEGDKAPVPVVPTAAGLLVVSINYRMYPAFRFPAMIQDVRCVIRFLRAHAAEYNLDPERFALIGHSAGGHLAALAGLAEESAGWDEGPYRDQSSRVQAVIPMSAPTDLTCSFPDWVNTLKEQVFGAPQLASSSPATYARQDAPPFLIVHGEADDVVPVEQAYRLHEALTSAGASSRLVIMKNAGHGLDPLTGPVAPTIEEAFGILLGFLAQTLRL